MVIEATFSRPTELDRAYAAGLFDGEGSVCISTRKTRSTKHPERVYVIMQVSLVTTTPALHDWLYSRWGGNISKPVIAALRRPDFMPMRNNKLFSKPWRAWQCSYQIGARFLRDIEPFLVLKKALARNAIELCEFQLAKRWAGPMTDEGYAVQLKHLAIHRRLSPRGKGYRYGTASQES